MTFAHSTIGELCGRGLMSLQTGPFGSQLHSYDYVEVGVPVVPTEAIRDRRIDWSVLPKVARTTADRLARHRLEHRDILFARRGAQATGQSAFVRESDVGAICGTGAIRLRVADSQCEISAAFLSHYLASAEARAWIRAQAIGATMPNLNEGIIRRIRIPLPKLCDQVRIADVLDSFDDKIELNRRMNETLEAMAQATFRDWFVDFGPTRRKVAGATDPVEVMGGLMTDGVRAESLADLFPDRFGNEGLPEGMDEALVATLIEFNPSEPLKRGTVAPYTDMGSLPTRGTIADPPVQREFNSGMRFRNGDALMARITPCLENGKAAFVDFLPDASSVGWGSTEFIVLRARRPIPSPFAYLLVRHPEFRDRAIRSMTGTSGRQRAQADSLSAFPIVRPHPDVLGEFGKLAEPWFEMISVNSRQNCTLAATRDVLLPKLMSGEIRLGDAETIAEAAE